MEVDETRHDVNLTIGLFMQFPGQKQESHLQIALAPMPLDNGRYFPGSDPVSVTYWGDTDDDGLVEWTITAAPYNDDGDGLSGEDPLDGIDNDGDLLTDEDFPGGCVTQNHFWSQPEVGYLPFHFEITVTAPAP